MGPGERGGPVQPPEQIVGHTRVSVESLGGQQVQCRQRRPLISALRESGRLSGAAAGGGSSVSRAQATATVWLVPDPLAPAISSAVHVSRAGCDRIASRVAGKRVIRADPVCRKVTRAGLHCAPRLATGRVEQLGNDVGSGYRCLPADLAQVVGEPAHGDLGGLVQWDARRAGPQRRQVVGGRYGQRDPGLAGARMRWCGW